jgi:hypothetical protein
MKTLMLAIAAGILLTGCAYERSGGPPPWAPAYGHRAQLNQYYYYPASGVYLNVATGTYYYMNGGSWQMGMSLPPTMIIDSGAYVSLQLDTDRPYLYYDQHRGQYAGWRGNGNGIGNSIGIGHGRGHGRWK